MSDLRSTPRGYHAVRRACVGTAALLWLACGPEKPIAPAPTPERIVSLSLPLSRILVEIGLSTDVVGVDPASLTLPELARATVVTPIGEAALRAILALEPTVVCAIATPQQLALADSLRASGVDALVLAPRTANDAVQAIHTLGARFGRETAAARVAARWTRDTAQIATARDGLHRLRVAWVLRWEPLVVVGSTGILHEILELAGAENAFHEPGADRLAIDPPALVAAEPELILDSSGAPSGHRDAIDAAQAPVRSISPSIASVPTLELVEHVRALHAALYPSPASLHLGPTKGAPP